MEELVQMLIFVAQRLRAQTIKDADRDHALTQISVKIDNLAREIDFIRLWEKTDAEKKLTHNPRS